MTTHLADETGQGTHRYVGAEGLLNRYLPIALAAIRACPHTHDADHLEKVMLEVLHQQTRTLRPLPAHVFEEAAGWSRPAASVAR